MPEHVLHIEERDGKLWFAVDLHVHDDWRTIPTVGMGPELVQELAAKMLTWAGARGHK